MKSSKIISTKIFVLLAMVVVLATATEDVIRKQQEHAIDEESLVNKENSESWTGWAKDKISEGLGFKASSDADADDVAASTIDAAAKKTKDKITDSATGAGEYASEKAGEAKDKAAEATEAAKRKVSEKTEEAYEKSGELKEKAEERSKEAKDRAAEEAKDKGKKAEEQVGWAKEKAKEGYEAAKDRAAETYESAKDKVASNLEAAKERSKDIIKDDDLTSSSQVDKDDEL
ncbi:hypothetical protein CASFOL_030202 [Castilleja foliolosa]|uniref:Late embryogenesis abundant protein D-29 n=1 Tax=Castilleja foliolosa TaxID=1961234 RepID=A0ABD3C9Y0_9LAMI